MAQELVTDSGTLIIPGGYATFKVAASNSGIAANGILMLVGEADAGPDWTLETDIEDNSFGPDSLSEVVAKYKSGPLVDAYRSALTPSKDANIQGAPSALILVKTNVSAKAEAALPKVGGGTYGTLADKSYGQLGNLIYFQTTAKTAEVQPTTSTFTYIPAVGTVATGIRVNGGAQVSRTSLAAETPTTFVSGVGGLTGVSCTGGALRTVLPVSGTLAIAASGNVVTITYSSTWTTTPSVGDTLMIPVSSVIAGGADQNVGGYVITAATTSTITATKLSDAAKPGAVIGTVTAPLTVTAQSVLASTDIEVYSPVTITESSTSVIDGVGKALEICDLATGTDLLANTAYVLGTTTKVSWISNSTTGALLTSAAEYQVSMSVARQADNVSETIVGGGTVALLIGYKGTTATVTITATQISTTVTGGSGASIPATNLKNFPTLNDLAKWINSQTGYVCAVATASLGQLNPLALDEGTFGICSTYGVKAGRIKYDAYSFFTAVSASTLVQLGDPTPAQALAGLPDVMTAVTYLAGGARGGTTNAEVFAAIDGLTAVDGNFLVPLFSRDATADISDSLTDSASTYTVDAINAYALTHCIAMSTLKRKKNRQAFLSKRDTYANVKVAAANLASHRASLSFEDLKDVGADGIEQFQPWMAALKAAAFQAAGFYRSIFSKAINASGALQAAADWNPKNQDDVESALTSGLLPIVKDKTKGWIWSSDQTTYLKDDNFVLNSIQAVYAADIVTLTSAQRMQDAFVGQSLAEVTAAQVLTAFAVVMDDLRGLKLISKSDDAPLGYKNVVVKIKAGAIQVEAEVKLATSVYFAKIGFLITEVTQTASQ